MIYRRKLQLIFRKRHFIHSGKRYFSAWVSQSLNFNVSYILITLRHCATSRKVAGSIPDGVIGIFQWHNPSGRTMALRLTQPLTEMSTRNISLEVKAVGALGWQPYHLHVPIVLKSWSLILLEILKAISICSSFDLNNILFFWSPYIMCCFLSWYSCLF